MEMPDTPIRTVPDGPLFRLRVPARADRLRLVRATVAEAVALCGFAEAAGQDVVLAVDEACQNVIRHAYKDGAAGDMVIEMDRAGDHAEVRIIDFAPPVDPASIKPRDLDDVRPGGIGTHIIRAVMEGAEFLPPPAGAGNLLRMTKKIG